MIGRENVRFFEPHTLSPILWEMVHEGKGEREALRAARSLSSVLGEMEERNCGSKSHTFSLSVLREVISDRQRGRTVLRAAHTLTYFLGHVAHCI